MLRCSDNSIYTGITNDIKRRRQEHFTKDKNCAKYTEVHTAKRLEALWQSEDRKNASKLEFHIKTLSKDKKENLIKNNDNFEKFLGKKLEVSLYERCKIDI